MMDHHSAYSARMGIHAIKNILTMTSLFVMGA